MGCPVQPGIDGGRGDLPETDRLDGRSWTMLSVATGEDAGHGGHLGMGIGHDKAARFSTPLPSRQARSVP